MSGAPTKVRFVDDAPDEPAWLALHRAADRNIPKVAVALPASMDVLRANANRERLRIALERNAPELVLASFPWGLWARKFERLVTPRIAETMRAGAEAAGRKTRIAKQEHTLQGVFDLTNPRAQREAAKMAAELVTLIDQNTKMAMRDVIAEAMGAGLSLWEQADRLESILIESAGLDSQRAGRLERFRRSLVEQDLPDRIIRQRVGEMRDRLITERARLIARNETMHASNAGQVELWRQAEEQGVLPVGIEREWIAASDRRVCPICDPMNGQRRRDGDLFLSPFNGQTYARPPAHVACRCVLALAIDD